MTRKRAKKITSVYHLHLCLARHIKPLTALTANKNQSICKTIRFDHTILCFVVAPTLHNAPTVISLSLQVFALRFLSMFFCRISLHCAAFFCFIFRCCFIFIEIKHSLNLIKVFKHATIDRSSRFYRGPNDTHTHPNNIMFTNLNIQLCWMVFCVYWFTELNLFFLSNKCTAEHVQRRKIMCVIMAAY